MKTSIHPLLIAAILLLPCCGKQPAHKDIYVEPELEQYALEFAREMNVATDYISMKFGKLSAGEMGVCTSWTDGKRDITIDTGYWSALNDLAKVELTYHELGHCAMNLEHDSTLVLDPSTTFQIEATVMNPYFFGNAYNWIEYVDKYKQALKTKTYLSF